MFATLGFGDAPVQGRLHLRPSATTINWRYSIDLDGDGDSEHAGVLEGEIGFDYEFGVPGIHGLRVSLTGPAGTEAISVPVVVNDPGAIQTLAQRTVQGSNRFENTYFEGITLNRAGTDLYVGDFGNWEVHRLDATFLTPVGPPLALSTEFDEELEWAPGGPEGLSITPSDSILLVAHKRFGLSVVAIPSMQLRRTVPMSGEFFIHALDDSTALTPDRFGASLAVVDTRTGETLRGIAVPVPWHFSVLRSAGRVAVLDRSGSPALLVASFPNLQEITRIPLPQLSSVSTIAFDPRGDRVYILGWSSLHAGAAFVLVDLIAGRVLQVMALGPHSCFGFCVANPVATLASGRYVVMEHAGGAYFIDTTFDIPRFRSNSGDGFSSQSVAASATEDVVFLLRGDGLLVKARIVH